MLRTVAVLMAMGRRREGVLSSRHWNRVAVAESGITPARIAALTISRSTVWFSGQRRDGGKRLLAGLGGEASRTA
jgi:hypothetical protein